MAKVVLCRNPFRPQAERDLVSVRAGTRIDTMLRQQSLVKGRASRLQRLSTFVVQVNGTYLLADQWARRIRNEDVVVVSLLPGDGGGGSNPLKMVLQIALIAAAVYTGGVAALAWGAAAGAIVSAGVMLAGTLLLNLAFPPPKPNVMQAREQASPTHTLSAQGNMARLQEAIPVLYGRHMVFPDFAAQPYTETDSNNTYLYQLFCLGQGELDIERIRIEETPIENFAEVSWEVVRPGGLVTLFPDNVVTSSIVQGLELKGSNEEGGGWMGPYVTNPAGTRANVIGIDISLPQGLYYANDEGGLDGATVSWRIEVRPINDEGAPAGEWTLLGEERWGEATATPQIKSFRYEVPDGRFEVRAMRIGTKNLDQRCANTVSWAGLRAYLPSTQSYGDVTLLAVAMRATNNLNQSTSRRINVIATRKLHVWDPVAGWSQDVRATRNPAWALADMLRSRVYGRGMLDTAYNLPQLYRLAQVWEQRRDYYDDVIDTTMTLWDALSRAARVGRAVPMYYAGLIDFVRNEPRSIPRAMFTPDNIVDGSFSINYSFIEHDSPDHVVIEYVDSETWQPAEVACVLPGGTQERPARVQLPGVTNRDQAWREGISMAAANRDQRIAPSLQTELDGHIPNFLDLVTVVHDTPKWGLSGFVTAWDPATRRLQVSEPLEWYVGQQHYISLRQRDGTPRGPFRVTAGRDELECVLVSPPSDLYVSEGEIEEPTLYAFGPGERTGLKALVRRAVPDESGHVTLELVNYADSVHSAELGGEVPPPPPASLLPLTPDAPIVAEVTVYATASPSEQIASCTPARGAETYEFEASQDQGQSWTRLGADTIPSLTIHLPVGPWWVRARGVGKNPGPWKTWQGHISATMLPPPVLTHFVASPVLWGIRLAWTWPTAIRLRYIEIWYSRTPSFLDATPMGQFAYPQGSHELTNLAITTELYFWARVRDEADQPGPWYPESGPGVRGTPNQVASEYNDLVTPEIVEGGLGDLIMGNIREIPSIKNAVGDLTLELGELNQRVDEVNSQVEELLSAGEWNVGDAYAVGTVVFADGKMYRAKNAVPAGTPITSTAHWELIGDYASITDGLVALAIQSQETISRVENAEGLIQANAEQISTVAGQVNNPETGLGALGSAVQSMRTQVGQLQDGLQSLSESTTALSSRVDGLDQAQRGLATAVQSLTTRVTATEGRLDSQASSITQLGTSVTNADAKAVAAQQAASAAADAAGAKGEVIFGSTAPPAAKRLAQNLWIDTAGNANTPKRWNGSAWVAVTDKAASDAASAAVAAKAAADAAQATANQKADASAVNALTTRVEQAEGGLASQGQAVTALQNTVNDPGTGVAAIAGALNDTKSRVTDIEGRQDAMASNQLILSADIKRQAPDENAELERVLNQWQTQANLSEFKSVQADENRALAESITTLTAVIGQDSAAVEEIMRSLVELDGKISASWGIKLQANANGVQYVAGVGLDLTNESGVMQSTFAVLAERFAVMHATNGDPVTVFSVQGGTSILNTALIGFASITEAKIANAAISRAKIQDAAINAAKIQDAAITSAKIQNAAIKTAHIGHAEVDTLRLAGNSVSVTAYATAGAGELAAGSTFRSVAVGLALMHGADVVVTATVEGLTNTQPGTLADTGHELVYDTGGYDVAAFRTVSDFDNSMTAPGVVVFKGWVPAGWQQFSIRQRSPIISSLSGKWVGAAAIRIEAFMR
jgi:predicted phage tail protein/uncharacterized protein YoxC